MKLYYTALGGATSGFISFVFETSSFTQFFPGLIFGLYLIIVLFSQLKKRSFVLTSIAFLVLSGIGYFLAFWTFIMGKLWLDILLPVEVEVISEVFALLIAGGIGSGMLVLGIHVFVFKLSRQEILVLLLMGSLLSLAWLVFPRNYLTGDVNEFHPFKNNMLSLFVTWQMGMASGFGWATRNKD